MLKLLAIIIFILICILSALGGLFLLKKIEISDSMNRSSLSSRYDLTLSPLTTTQEQTYLKNKKPIEAFISQINPELQNWMKNVVIIMLDDVNHYLTSNRRPEMILQDIELATDKEIEDVLKSSNPDTIIIDAREAYEKKFTELDKVFNASLSRLLNNEYGTLSKDQKIIVICHTASRSFITANYLKSQGFKNIKSYNGGVMAWLENSYPVKKAEEFKFIYQTLPYLSEEKAILLKNSSNDIDILLFDSAANPKTSINPLLETPEKLNQFIKSLSKNKKYIIKCTDNHHCFEASMFWDAASSQEIQFLGYTGFSRN